MLHVTAPLTLADFKIIAASENRPKYRAAGSFFRIFLVHYRAAQCHTNFCKKVLASAGIFANFCKFRQPQADSDFACCSPVAFRSVFA